MTQAKQARPRARPDDGSWYEAHAAAYDRLHPGVEGDVEFYRIMAEGVTAPILEVGCGAGRIARALAAEGHPVVGLDRSAAMLREARAQTPAGTAIDWIQADMRRFALRARFGLIVIPYRTLQHTATAAELAATLACCADHLTTQGLIAFDLTHAPALARPGWTPTGRVAPPRVQRLAPGLALRLIEVDEARAAIEAAGLSGVLMGSFRADVFRPATATVQVWLALPPSLAAGQRQWRGPGRRRTTRRDNTASRRMG